MAFSENDSRLKPLIDATIKYQKNIAVGAPLITASPDSPLASIALIIIDSLGKIQAYQKMHLHSAEESYFSPGNKHHLITLNDTKIASAICADTNNPEHFQKCVDLRASVYIASSMITDGGYKADTDKLQAYAKEHGMLIALANYSASTIPFTGGWIPIGKNCILDQ